MKPRLLHLHAPLSFGGGEVFLGGFYENSAEKFDNRTILFGSSRQFEQGLHIPFSVFYHRELGPGSTRGYLGVLFYSLRHLWRLRKLIKENESDYIIGHGFPFSLLIPILKSFGITGRAKLIYFQHSRLRRPSYSWFWRNLYRAMLSRFDLILVNSSQVKNDISTPIPSLADKLLIFYPTMNLSQMPRPTTKGHSGIRAVYSARPAPAKNHRLFFELLFAIPADIRNNFLLLLIGVPSSSPLVRDFDEAGFEHFIEPCGEVTHEKALRITSEADICLFPSLQEGFGLSLFEALSLGVPSVALKSAVPPELHEFIVAADSADDFITKTMELLESRELLQKERERLGKKLPQLKRFELASSISALYNRLLPAGPLRKAQTPRMEKPPIAA